MIHKILLRNVNSYSPFSAVTIAPLKRVSVFYGQNGTGKTTIGNYLQAPDDSQFEECQLEPIRADREILVYNHLFVERNFHEATSQPGVFTLNEGNIEADKEIAEAEATIRSLQTTHDEHMAAGIQAKVDQEAAREKLKEKLWRQKVKFDNTALAYCFKLLNSKEKLLAAVCASNLASTSDTADKLLAEAAQLQGASDVEAPRIPSIKFHGAGIEADPILTEIIAGTGDSYLSELIQELGNSDWVKHAISYESSSNGQCPLCQQSLPSNFFAELRKVFDKTYESRLSALNALHQQYKRTIDQLLIQSESPLYHKDSIQIHLASLRAALQKNIQSIESKLASPSTAVILDDTDGIIASLNDAINVEQIKIDEINEKIKHKQAHLDSIKERFWLWLRTT